MIDLMLGDCLERMKEIPDQSIQTCITSPPYFNLRDYGVENQIGLEKTSDSYIQKLIEVFIQVHRVLTKDGTLWLNLGDTYGKGKQLLGIPWQVAFALQKNGWILRQDIIWHKPNPMPESVKDRCTKAHEYIFLLSKSEKYFFDNEIIREPFSTNNKGKSRDRGITPLTAIKKDRSNSGGFEKKHNGKNKRSVWSVKPKPFKGAHFATFPKDLILPCVLAGSKPRDIVLDPFMGAGTTGLVAKENDRKFIGIELNPQYFEIAKKRILGGNDNDQDQAN